MRKCGQVDSGLGRMARSVDRLKGTLSCLAVLPTFLNNCEICNLGACLPISTSLELKRELLRGDAFV